MTKVCNRNLPTNVKDDFKISSLKVFFQPCQMLYSYLLINTFCHLLMGETKKWFLCCVFTTCINNSGYVIFNSGTGTYFCVLWSDAGIIKYIYWCYTWPLTRWKQLWLFTEMNHWSVKLYTVYHQNNLLQRQVFLFSWKRTCLMLYYSKIQCKLNITYYTIIL